MTILRPADTCYGSNTIFIPELLCNSPGLKVPNNTTSISTSSWQRKQMQLGNQNIFKQYWHSSLSSETWRVVKITKALKHRQKRMVSLSKHISRIEKNQDKKHTFKDCMMHLKELLNWHSTENSTWMVLSIAGIHFLCSAPLKRTTITNIKSMCATELYRPLLIKPCSLNLLAAPCTT